MRSINCNTQHIIFGALICGLSTSPTAVAVVVTRCNQISYPKNDDERTAIADSTQHTMLMSFIIEAFAPLNLFTSLLLTIFTRQNRRFQPLRSLFVCCKFTNEMRALRFSVCMSNEHAIKCLPLKCGNSVFSVQCSHVLFYYNTIWFFVTAYKVHARNKASS